MKPKKANLIHQIIVQVILVILVFGMFFAVISSRVNSASVKQQLLERQISLFIDSAEPGFNLTISKINVNGYINSIEIKQGRVFVYVDSIRISKGYPYFTRYNAELKHDESNYYINIRE